MPPAAAATAADSCNNSRRGRREAAAVSSVDVLDGEALEARRQGDEEGGFLVV